MSTIANRRACALGLVGVAALGAALGVGKPDKVMYQQRNLVSNGSVPAEHVDPNLVNPWGLAANPVGFWWVADNGTGVSTLYDGKGVPQPLVVQIPRNDPLAVVSGPTGIVFNGGMEFVITDGVNAEPARFIFATREGTIAAWAPGIPPPPPSTRAQVVVDKSDEGAGYTGLAIARTAAIHGAMLYAADFANKRVDVFNGEFRQVSLAGAAFEDPTIPPGFGPFGIQTLGGEVYVTYAMVGDDGDEVVGRGLGYVNVFNTNGKLVKRLGTKGPLNAPWGIARAPDNFGPFSNAVLIGNFGDGRINAYEWRSGKFLGQLMSVRGTPFQIDGLWGIAFGNGKQAGPANRLYFSAGPNDEANGLFGSIDAVDARRKR